jgi:uncharacterized membrane protein YcaP (DUF421 family)
MGKKQLGELQPSELVTTILISNIATLALEDPDLPLLSGVIPILAIVCLDVFITVGALKCDKLRRLITGNPRVLIRDGVINQREMKNLRFTIEDLMESARDAGIFDVSRVQYAIVETTGKINFFTEQQNPPVLVVSDGVIDPDALRETGLDEEWLEEKLVQKKLSLSQVFILTANEKGNCYIIKKGDKS